MIAIFFHLFAFLSLSLYSLFLFAYRLLSISLYIYLSFSFSLSLHALVPSFIVNPRNITVPTNGTAGFYCSILSDTALINITWTFQPIAPIISGTNEIVDDVEDIIEGFPHTGTSVLLRNNVTQADSGFYRCVAYYSSGVGPITSDGGYLEIDGKWLGLFFEYNFVYEYVL